MDLLDQKILGFIILVLLGALARPEHMQLHSRVTYVRLFMLLIESPSRLPFFGSFGEEILVD
jgi:hypothetical protein